MSPHEIDQHELPLFIGRFSFKHDVLQKILKKTFPKYDFYDPRTWPRVVALQVKNSIGHEYDGSGTLPEGVAYDREIVEKYTSQHLNDEASVKAINGTTVMRCLYVQLFPYFYQRGGQMRKTGYMTADHLIARVRPLTGKTPETGEKGGPHL